jgi:hypothetical protein
MAGLFSPAAGPAAYRRPATVTHRAVFRDPYISALCAGIVALGARLTARGITDWYGFACRLNRVTSEILADRNHTAACTAGELGTIDLIGLVGLFLRFPQTPTKGGKNLHGA